MCIDSQRSTLQALVSAEEAIRLQAIWQLEPAWPAPTSRQRARFGKISKLLQQLGPTFIETQGVRVPVDASLDPHIVDLLLHEAYEADDLRLIRQHAALGAHGVVLGCGLGLSAVALAQTSANPVLALDALPELGPRILKIAAANNVRLDFKWAAIAPGVSRGNVPFFRTKEFWSSSLSPKAPDIVHVYQTPVADLDELLSLRPFDTIVIDIEGTEKELLQNQHLPHSVNTLFVEIHRPNLGGKLTALTMNQLWKTGFELQDMAGLVSVWTRR